MVGLSRPVSSGFASGASTSLNVGLEKSVANCETLLLSSWSPAGAGVGFASLGVGVAGAGVAGDAEVCAAADAFGSLAVGAASG